MARPRLHTGGGAADRKGAGDMLNSRDISLLRADVAANCRRFLERCKTAGWPVLVTGTVRDEEFQLQCYRNGTSRSKTPTFHSVRAGLAFDVCKNVKGQEYSDDAFWRAISAIGKEMGFTWGGDWKSIVDKPHFQWDGGGVYTNSMIRAGNYPPEMPLWEEDDMTEAKVQELVDKALEAREAVRYDTLDQVPAWGRETVRKLMDKGALRGDGGGLGLSYDLLRVLVINDRTGLFN